MSNIKTSTGLRNAMLVTGSFKATMDDCLMKIYAGTPPASADDAIGAATLLCTVSDDATGTGLTFDATASGGVVTKTPAQIWRGVNAASGTAAFYRLEQVADDQSATVVHPRVQGLIALAGASVNLSSVALTLAASQSIDYYSMSVPSE